MNGVWIIAKKEIREGLRNRWVLGASALLLVFALGLVLLGSAPAGTRGVGALTIALVSLSSLTVYVVPLMALLLAFDAIAGEVERGSLPLLLTYPITRWQVVIGKFIGHSAILAFAIMVGYGGAAGVLILRGAEDIAAVGPAYAAMMASSIALGAGFLAIGYVASAWVRERATAAGLALAIWLGLVLFYDLGLLALIIADQNHSLATGLVHGLLLANPADAYRLFNLSDLAGNGEIARVSGLSGLALPWGGLGPLAVLAAWTALPLAACVWILHRREL